MRLVLAFVVACSALGAHAQSIAPTVCIEYVPGSSNFVARWGYINTFSEIYLPFNSAGNYVTPIRTPPGVPEVFAPGVNFGFSELIPGGTVEVWHLGVVELSAESTYYYDAYVSANPAATPPPASPVCPVALLPASLSYSAPGTYNNVFLAQVNSGPTAAGVTVTGFSTQPGITISNLTYVPADPAAPTGDLNPNSIYGTVTVLPGADATTQALLLLTQNGAELNEALLPITYTGPPPVATVSVPTQSVALGTATAVVDATVAYTGGVAPTGAVTLAVEGVAVPATCTRTSSPLQCSGTVATSGLAQGAHTVTASLAADSLYAAASGTGALDAVATTVLTWQPSTATLFDGAALGTGVLDASANSPGTISYTAMGSTTGGTDLAVNAATVLQAGTYVLTATFAPSDPTSYSSATATKPLSVATESVFLFSATGGYVSLSDPFGDVLAGPVAGSGGIGAAVDANGFVWSINPDGASLSKISAGGVVAATYSGLGLSGATALAIDGNGNLWVTNGDGSVSEVSNAGTLLHTTPSGVATASSLSIDESGDVWVANPGANSVTEFLGAAAPTLPVATAVTNMSPGARP